MTRLAVARPQHEEGILAEEAVAGDPLAAFDALEQERVVGVLGDLEEGRRRRQQVGEDLLVDGHERAARRQLRELFERRLLHTDVPASVLARPAGVAGAIAASRASAASRRITRLRRDPGPPRELADGLRDEHVEAIEGAAPGGRGVTQQPRRPRVVDEVVDQRAGPLGRSAASTGDRSTSGCVPTGVVLTSRSQLPRGTGHGPAATCAGVAPAPAAASGRRACTDTRAPARQQAADDRARRSAGADDRGPPALERLPGQRRQEACDVGVEAVPAAGAAPQRVERAALPRRPRRVVLERRRHAGAGDAERVGEGEEVVEVGRLARDVDAVDAGRRERGVVHGRRDRMADRPAGDRIDRRRRADAADPELVAQAIDA